MEQEQRRETVAIRHPEAKPTPRQIYALAHALCVRAGEEFPGTRGAASKLIERLRTENEETASV
jgi:hypothetical protein